MKCLAYITASNEEEAEKISAHLLQKRLVACVNYFPIKSSYWWNGKIENDSEYALICKSREDLAEQLISEVRQVHSYDVPVIDIIPVGKGYKELDDWLIKETTE